MLDLPASCASAYTPQNAPLCPNACTRGLIAPHLRIESSTAVLFQLCTHVCVCLCPSLLRIHWFTHYEDTLVYMYMYMLPPGWQFQALREGEKKHAAPTSSSITRKLFFFAVFVGLPSKSGGFRPHGVSLHPVQGKL